MRKQVIIRGPLLTMSGYGCHTRQIFKWLLSHEEIDLYTQVLSWGMTPWMINPDHEDGITKEIMKRSVWPKDKKFDLSVQVQLPNEWDTNIARKNIGVTALVETDVCNPAWIECINRMDCVVVPSSHTLNTIMNTGKPIKPVHVIPESYYESIDNKDIKVPDINFSTKFNFLVFGQLTGDNPQNDRKNLFNTMKIFAETFADDPDVGIIIKTNSGKNTKIDKFVTNRTVDTAVQKLRGTKMFPRFYLLHGAMTSEEVAGLYHHPDIKALVSLTRGEGYGLPLLEAAASGLPVIATNWSGHLDFLKRGKFINVDYSLRDVHPSRIDNHIWIKGSKWAEPDEAHAKKRIKKFRESPATPTGWAKDLSKTLKKEFSQSAIVGYYNKILGDYLR